MCENPGSHDSQWRTVSRHLTSEGLVAYQRCGCGGWRIRLHEDPVGVTAVLSPRLTGS
jgi:hypothetical protein